MILFLLSLFYGNWYHASPSISLDDCRMLIEKKATMKLNTKPLEMGKYGSETSISFYISMYAIITTTHFYTYIPWLLLWLFLFFFSFGNSLWINTTWNSCREYTNECNIYQQKRLKQRINKLCSLNSMHGNNDGREEKKSPRKKQ